MTSPNSRLDACYSAWAAATFLKPINDLHFRALLDAVFMMEGTSPAQLTWADRCLLPMASSWASPY